MENLSIQDGPSPAPPAGGAHQIPQLPPQMFTTAASLLDLTDKKLIVTLRDGRKIIGILRSWDQFGNLVLQDSVERIVAEKAKLFADIPHGLYLVRGENVTIMGEIDLDKDDEPPPAFVEDDPDKVFKLRREEEAQVKTKEGKKLKLLKHLGFEGEHMGEALI